MMTGPDFGEALLRMVAYQALAELFEGRSVLEVGCGEGTGLRHLFALGARRVLGVDSDVRAARRQIHGLGKAVAVRGVRPPRLSLGPERFERIVVADVATMQRWVDWVQDLKAALAPGGLLLLRAQSADEHNGSVADGVAEGRWHYGDLLDLVEPHFASVQVFGQAPFLGGSVVELGAASPEPDLDLSLDLSLMGGEGESLAAYLVLCSERPQPAVEDLGFNVVQIPTRPEEALSRWWDAVGARQASRGHPTPATPETAAARPAAGQTGSEWTEEAVALPDTGRPGGAKAGEATTDSAGPAGSPPPAGPPPEGRPDASLPRETAAQGEPGASLDAFLDGAGGRIRRWIRK